MQKILTIVVPVYKVEQYINKCLDSCIVYKEDGSLDEQRMNQLEVIIVNDGTPDRSAEFSREYTVRYPDTFRQIDKENGGHGSAWNAGLKEAKGKYLRFLDSDDWLTSLDKLMDKLADTDADVVFTDYVRVHEQTGAEDYRALRCPAGQTLLLTKDMLYQQPEGSFSLNFWHTTYKTAILQPQWPLFEEHVMYDDSILCHAPLLYGRTYLYLDMPVYHYLIGRAGQSMDSRVMARNVRCYYRCYARQVEWMEEAFTHDLPEDYRICIRESVQHYAGVVFGHLTCLPFREAKEKMAYYYREAYVDSHERHGKMVRRYEQLPFFLFYGIEQLRNLKSRIINHNS